MLLLIGVLIGHSGSVCAWDLRVAKALGSRGDDEALARVSVISTSAEEEAGAIRMLAEEAVGPLYSGRFRYKWRAAFDLGTPNASCGKAYAAWNGSAPEDDECSLACADDSECGAYAFKRPTCQLFRACELEAGDWEVHQKLGDNRVTTTIVRLPALGIAKPPKHPKGVVIGDPCFSSRFMTCAFGEAWDTFNRTILMLNALAPDVDFFAFVGDLFYDRDGTLTRAVWDRLTPEFKRRIVVVVPGNYDFWAGGGPPGDAFDQYAWGFAQFYAQDTLASREFPFLDFDFDDDAVLKHPVRNLVFYHNIGDLGFLGYSGGPANETVDRIDWEEPCAFFNRTAPRAVFLLGHWSDASLGCDAQADTPAVRAMLSTLDGCRDIIYFDGHMHCNEIQEPDYGFNVGGHGMLPHGCSQYGFALVDSTSTRVAIDYFEERNNQTDRFDDIYDCVTRHQNRGGVANCRHFAAPWR
ncbi:hypothetical protein CTAYLR_006236 [Chrysophaeum taylorii]|uniref:Calcineurin-like phosphoesterase domain-containing protein n=1 Tax=Chrysophaeum taylorii TaxID=2483200 RepID=A0AAD7UIE5_9STRA|nr:hypothetical protein CTAYLR_006236 [Chrysophaeum taylorii]